MYEKDAGKRKLGTDGLRMSREEECATKEDIGVLRSGKIFRYSRKRIMANKEEKHSEVEERDIGAVLYIEGIPHIEEKEKYH